MMQTTTSSTALDDRERERREGSVLWAKTKALLDELNRLRPDDAHARAERTAAVESRIESAIEEKRAVLQAQHRSARTTTLQDYVKRRDDKKPPTRAVIQRVLKKHDLY